MQQNTGVDRRLHIVTRREFVRGLCMGSLACAGIVAGGGVSCMFCSCSGMNGKHAKLHDVKDMLDRDVMVPENIRSVFCSNPIGTVDLYILAPQYLAGWNFRPSGDNKKYISDEYMALPSLGVWMGAGATPNDEEIVKQDPDVILCYWTADDVGGEMADEVQDETGVCTLAVDYDVRSAPEMLRYVSSLLNVCDRGESLAQFCEERIGRIRGIVAAIPAAERKSIYLAQGEGGLSTDPVGSMHVTDALDLIGVSNVADLPGTEGKGMGMPTISLEQIIAWNPDAVLASEYSMSDAESSDLYDDILGDANWQNVKCVKNGDVYRIPQSPFSWFGRPPSIMRILGCLWLLKILYPAYTTDVDLVQETRDTYTLFYNRELSDAELRNILTPAGIDVDTGMAQRAR
jgi:iron complex transport system substrate-binding protein